MDLKNIYGKVIFSYETNSTKELVEKAISLRANLTEANLSWTNLTRANLSWANLTRANLTEANLTEANLSWANLSWANLTGANLTRANLTRANLTGANLTRANLTRANITRANLTEANLSWANLTGANCINPVIMLLANWNNVSDNLCTELMRYDAFNHPNPEKFLIWSKGGICPYSEKNITRVAHFQEIKELYSPGPSKSAYELMIMLFKEKGIKFLKENDYENKQWEECEINVRTLNVLKKNNLITLGNVIQKTDKELLKIHGISHKSLKEIKDILDDHELKLKGE